MQLRKRELPDAYWVAWRLARNKRRSQRERERVRKRKEDERKQLNSSLKDLTPEERAKAKEAVEAAKQAEHAKKVEQQRKVEAAHHNGLKIVVEVAFAEKSNDREIRSLARQLQYCIAANRRAAQPGALHFASYTGPVREFAEERMGGSRWLAHFHTKSALELFPKEDIIVMSPDAEEPLTEVDPGKIYLIGGLVDRSIQKNTTAKFAEEEGIVARRLPLKEHMGKSYVLNVNHVAEALLAVHGGAEWGPVLEGVVPQRKAIPNPRKRQRAGKDGGEGGAVEDIQAEEDGADDGGDDGGIGAEEEAGVAEGQDANTAVAAVKEDV